MKAKKIGQILAEKGYIADEVIEQTLRQQKKSNLRFGQLLIQQGHIGEEELLESLSAQYGHPHTLRLQIKNIEEIVEKVPLKFIQKYKIVPFSLEDNTVKIAINDPAQIHPLDEMRMLWIGFQVEIWLTTDSEILKVIHSHFEKNADAKDTDENLEFLNEIEDIGDSLDLASETPIIKMVNMIFSNAIGEMASDIHIEPQERELFVRYRIDGVLHKVLTAPKSVQSGVLSRIKIMSGLNIAENRLPQDGRIRIRFSGKDIDVRVSTLPTQFGERVVMRLLNRTDTRYDIATIGFSDSLKEKFLSLLKEQNGIILITGPTGSGKTSTLYAALTHLNTGDKNIITVEDPVEYQIEGISQMQTRSSIGLTFAEGLRSILRQDPNVIMVGEIRDSETAGVAIQSALTGHLVLSTLHTNDSASSISRLLDMGIEPFLINATVRGIMAQRLVRRLCPNCKKTRKVTPAEAKSLKVKTNTQVYDAVGCEKCMNTGYKGRTGIYELLVVDNAMRQLILQNPGIDEIFQFARKSGLTTLSESAAQKVLEGITSIDEMLRVT